MIAVTMAAGSVSIRGVVLVEILVAAALALAILVMVLAPASVLLLAAVMVHRNHVVRTLLPVVIRLVAVLPAVAMASAAVLMVVAVIISAVAVLVVTIPVALVVVLVVMVPAAMVIAAMAFVAMVLVVVVSVVLVCFVVVAVPVVLLVFVVVAVAVALSTTPRVVFLLEQVPPVSLVAGAVLRMVILSAVAVKFWRRMWFIQEDQCSVFRNIYHLTFDQLQRLGK